MTVPTIPEAIKDLCTSHSSEGVCGLYVLEGKTFIDVSNQNDDAIVFVDANDTAFALAHVQDCCENVYVASVDGDLSDLVGTPIVSAEATSDHFPADKDNYHEQTTYTFYHIRTKKGSVTIRFNGTSNGYYSTAVQLHSIGRVLPRS
jgi:hypothetical protein